MTRMQLPQARYAAKAWSEAEAEAWSEAEAGSAADARLARAKQEKLNQMQPAKQVEKMMPGEISEYVKQEQRKKKGIKMSNWYTGRQVYQV